MTDVATVYLSLGSNIEPEQRLTAAVRALRERFGAVILSPLYRTRAVGFEGDDFLNAAARIVTEMSPLDLNDWLHALEASEGRRRDVPRFSSRTLDVDMLLYDDLLLEGDGHLQLPRAELTQQAFVLKPMADIAPDLLHPTLGHTLIELWRAFPAPVPSLQSIAWPEHAGTHQP